MVCAFVFTYIYIQIYTKYSDVMGMMKVFGVEKSYSHNGAHSKMIHIELDYDVYIIFYISV